MRGSRTIALLTLGALAVAGCGSDRLASTATPGAAASAQSSARGVGPGDQRYEALCRPALTPVDTTAINGGPWKEVNASTFYVGEEANAANANISNVWTAWYSNAVQHFGSGPDSWGPVNPDEWEGQWYERDGLCPKGVVLKQNPFYIALPTPDHDEAGVLQEAEQWVVAASDYLPELKRFKDGKFADHESPFKDLWFEVSYQGKSAFAQLEDVGPSNQTGAIAADYEYVWGDRSQPKNEFGLQAGIDLSPAVTDYLGTDGAGVVRWRAVPESEVPDGPWKVLPTSGNPDWR